MSKKGMKRPEATHTQPENQAAPVQALMGDAKSGKAKARPIISGTETLDQKVYHSKPHGDN